MAWRRIAVIVLGLGLLMTTGVASATVTSSVGPSTAQDPTACDGDVHDKFVCHDDCPAGHGIYILGDTIVVCFV